MFHYAVFLRAGAVLHRPAEGHSTEREPDRMARQFDLLIGGEIVASFPATEVAGWSRVPHTSYEPGDELVQEVEA